MPTFYLSDADFRATELARVRQVLGRHDFVCGLTAARLYGVEARDRHSRLVWIGCPAGRRLRPREGCHVRELALEATDLDLLDGVLLTTPVRTLYDCARWLSPVEGLVVAESLVRAGLVTPAEAARYRNAHKGTRGVASVDRVLAQLEPRSGSAMQTRVRCSLVASGLPKPTAQHVVRDASGCFVARLELAYVGLQLGIVCDDGRDAPDGDGDSREGALRDNGWVLIHVDAANFDLVPVLVAEHIRTAIDSAA